jgi:mono/diheme cytochrome c family protein
VHRVNPSRLSLWFSGVTLLGLATSMAAGQKSGTSSAAALKNPVAATDDSIAAGRRTYQRLCVSCHGPKGKGDGGGAGGGGQPSDLTDDTWDHGSTDGEIFTAIHDGTSADMEPYGERISASDIWNLVNFIRSIGPPQKP